MGCKDPEEVTYTVIQPIMLTTALEYGRAKPMRMLEVNEILYPVDVPLKDTETNSLRIHCQAWDRKGYATWKGPLGCK